MLIIKTAAVERPAINNTIRNATEHVEKTQNISENIELENIEVKRRLSEANNTLSEVNKLVANSSVLLENTHITGTYTISILSVWCLHQE